MKRQLTSILLFSALLVGGASTFVSCTDHESDSAYNTSVSLADAIAKQKSDLTDLNDWLGQLKKDNPTLADAIDARIKANKKAIEDLMAENFVTYGKLDAAIQESEAYKGLKNEIAGIEKLRVKDSTAFAKMDSALQAKIDTLGTQVNSIEEMQNKMKTALDYLVNKNLSNIAINATENPVTGYWNAAFLGSQLNLVSSFYGVAKADGNEDWGIKGNKVIGENGNAGYIYVSLNPTELDPSLVEVELVNSQGEPAKGFKLGKIENTDKVLTYGYTRATSKNGFYQIPVIASEPQNDDFALDKGSLKEAAKTVLGELKDPKGNDLDLSKVAAALYKNNLNNKLTAYTVKATYYLYDAEIGEYVKKTQVAPTYNLAAFAVRPLSFKFLENNANLDKLSGWAVENFRLPSLSTELEKIAKALDVKITYDKADEFYTYTLIASNTMYCEQVGNDVVIYNDAKVAYDASTSKLKVINRGHVYKTLKNSTLETQVIAEDDAEFNIGDNKTEGVVERIYSIKTKDTTIADLLASANGQIANKLQPVKNVLSNVNAKWENVIAKVNPLLKKVSSKIGSANKMLQPTILYMDQNGNPNTLSTIGGRLGTRFVGTGATTLYATSWTAELLAPAYKKQIFVKEPGAEILVNGKATKEGETFDGSLNKVIFNATKGNTTYTIVYKAVDYSGAEVEKTFYVNVK